MRTMSKHTARFGRERNKPGKVDDALVGDAFDEQQAAVQSGHKQTRESAFTALSILRLTSHASGGPSPRDGVRAARATSPNDRRAVVEIYEVRDILALRPPDL